MRRLLVLAALLLASCANDPAAPGAAHPSGAQAPGGEEKPEPLSPEALRAKWEALARDEGQLATDVSMLSTYGPEEKVRKLQPVRANAGMLASGLKRLEPPPQLAACKQRALDGANKVKQALDGIHEIWMDRAARDRAAAEKLATDLCVGFSLMREGREACGVNAIVAAPMACR